jgi:restriction system protein
MARRPQQATQPSPSTAASAAKGWWSRLRAGWRKPAPATLPTDRLSAREFGALLLEAFRLQGFQVEDASRPDANVDVVLRKDRETHLLHAKQWQAAKVEVGVVEAFCRSMTARGVARGFVVSTERFSREATTYATLRNVRLVDGAALETLIDRARSARAAAARTAGGSVSTLSPTSAFGPPSTLSTPLRSPVQTAAPAPDGARTLPRLDPAEYTATSAPVQPLSPSCPLCGNDMVLRNVKRGPKAGRGFWGCAAHPACRGVRPLV